MALAVEVELGAVAIPSGLDVHAGQGGAEDEGVEAELGGLAFLAGQGVERSPPGTPSRGKATGSPPATCSPRSPARASRWSWGLASGLAVVAVASGGGELAVAELGLDVGLVLAVVAVASGLDVAAVRTVRTLVIVAALALLGAGQGVELGAVEREGHGLASGLASGELAPAVAIVGGLAVASGLAFLAVLFLDVVAELGLDVGLVLAVVAVASGGGAGPRRGGPGRRGGGAGRHLLAAVAFLDVVAGQGVEALAVELAPVAIVGGLAVELGVEALAFLDVLGGDIETLAADLAETLAGESGTRSAPSRWRAPSS